MPRRRIREARRHRIAGTFTRNVFLCENDQKQNHSYKNGTRTYLRRNWDSEVTYYDHCRSIRMNEADGSETGDAKTREEKKDIISLWLGGSQRVEEMVKAKIYDQRITYILRPIPSDIKSGQVIEQGYISLEYLSPSIDANENEKSCQPKIDDLNRIRPRIKYTIRHGPFSLNGSYIPWKKQIYTVSLQLHTSPYINEPFYAARRKMLTG